MFGLYDILKSEYEWIETRLLLEILMRSILKPALFIAALLLSPLAAAAEAGQTRLFVNLTTDDTWAAAKAIMFAQNELQEGV